MAEKPKDLKQGDPCPIDGGELVLVEGAAAKDGMALYRCRSCGYNTRFKAKSRDRSAAADRSDNDAPQQ
jgi:hypothetical protein